MFKQHTDGKLLASAVYRCSLLKDAPSVLLFSNNINTKYHTSRAPCGKKTANYQSTTTVGDKNTI